MEKKVDIEEEMDDVEKFLTVEREQTERELVEIQEELTRLSQSLADYIVVLDKEIESAFEAGDDKLWLSLTNKRALILQRLNEIAQILNKGKSF